MNEINTYQNRKVVWMNYRELLEDKMPESDWICLMTTSASKPDSDKFDRFTREAIKSGILEFKGHGKFSELLHDWFDETMVLMETVENHSEIEVMTTWHNDESLAETFWQCFFATCLPETTDYEKLKIVCTDLDGIDRKEELANYLNQFEQVGFQKPKDMFDTFGNKVRIKRTIETEERGLADKEGEVYGQTAPSMMGFEVIGTLKDDIAIKVHFDDLNQSF